ncbi:MAG: acetolactate synthase small subunit [Candidatus Gastranaerophilales bacterium]|nr:acetolactate synthase small subunit [Candidatus Gastranaerophilales bacterium]
MQHTISVLVKNEAGALSRMINLFSARGYNIESLTVSTTIDTKYARATIVVTHCDDAVVEQILKQLHKLIPVIKVSDLTPDNSITRELVFIKVDAKSEVEALLKIAAEFGAKIINVSPKTYTIQAVCNEEQLKSLIELLRPIGIKDVVRSGAVSILLNNVL